MNEIRRFRVILFFLALIIYCLLPLYDLQAQIDGITFRPPPMTHAFIDSEDVLLGIGLTQTKVENPYYQIAGVRADTLTFREQFAFLALGLSDTVAIGASYNPSEIELEGNDVETGTSVETSINSSRTYYYLIPTLYRWDKSRLALIWGKGTARVEENDTLDIEAESYSVGTTGLFGEFFLSDGFSIVPWMSWPYLLFDFFPPQVNDVQTPDYGFDGIIHAGEVKLSLTLIFQALETADETADEDEQTESGSDEESSQESYAISLSFTF